MSRLVFHPPPVQPSGALVRVDTTSGSTSPVGDTALLSIEGTPLPGTLPSDGVSGAVPAFRGPNDNTATLYLKTLNAAGSVTATVAVTGTSGGTPAPNANTADVAAAVAALVNSAPSTLDTLGELATALQGDEGTAAALATIVGQKAPALSVTATKTSAYTAAANELVPVSTAGGAVTITLPSAPSAGSRVAVKHTVQGGSNAVTVAAGGTDHFNTSTGSTSLTLPLLNQAVQLQYGSGVWLVVADDLPLSQLDARFAPVGTSVPVPVDPADNGKVVTAQSGALVLADPTGGGGGGSSALSARPIAYISQGTPVTIVAGNPSGTVDLTGASVATGEDYWGVPGSALPLAVTISAGGNLVVPDDDSVYDYYIRVICAADAADVGKYVGVYFFGEVVSASQWIPLTAVAPYPPGATFQFCAFDTVFVGDGAHELYLQVDASHLSADLTISASNVFVVKR